MKFGPDIPQPQTSMADYSSENVYIWCTIEILSILIYFQKADSAAILKIKNLMKIT